MQGELSNHRGVEPIMSDRNSRPGANTLLAFEPILDRFEAAWRSGQRPDLNEFACSVPEASRAALFSELLSLELAYRREAGEMPQISDYLAKFPQFAEQVRQCAAAAPKPHAAGALKMRCPHCHNPIEVLSDDPSGDVSCPSCGSSFNLAKDAETARYLDTGKMIGHFRLLDRLGQGAFGEVWKARDTELDRIVAIKIPRREHLTEQESEQFLREARAAAQVRHPNIVSVYEVGRERGVIYIASDFIDGATLDQWVQAHPLTVRESVELCAQIAEALHHAHEAGVVHRDLKPQNILVRMDQGTGVRGQESGIRSQRSEKTNALHRSTGASSLTPDSCPLTPFITDFGLAKRDAGEITVTIDGAILGTPAYMPPEQARGEAHQADRRSDVYSLGVILFRLLTGELPFRGQRQMLIVQILNEEPPALRKLDAHIPRDVETICLKCLEKDPTRRYQTAAALSADLRRWLTGHPIEARPVSRTERTWRWCHRNPAIASLSATVVLVLLTGMVVSSFFALQSAARNRSLQTETTRANQQATKATENSTRADKKAAEALAAADRERKEKKRADAKADEALVNAKEALIEKHRADAKADEARHHLYSARMNLVQRNWENSQVGLVLDLLEKTRPQPGETDLRGFEWYYWDRLCQWPLLELNGDTSVAFSADGKRLASASHGSLNGRTTGVVTVWDFSTGQETLRLKGNIHRVACVAFSPDGERLAAAGYYRTVDVWDAKSGRELLTLKGHTEDITSLAISPDGKRLASASGRSSPRKPGVVKVWNLTSGKEMLTLTGHAWGVNSVAFSPDGTRLASAGDDQTVKVWDATSGQETLTLKGHTRYPIYSVAYSADGKRLASASSDGVKVWDVTSGQETLTLKGHTGWVMSVAFSPDGKRLASASGDQTVKVWDATSGQEAFTLKGHTDAVTSVAFSPDGKRLASSSSDGVKVWDATSGQGALTWKDLTDKRGSVALSKDGNWLAWANFDQIKVRDTTSGQETLTLNGHTNRVTSVAFSADGKWLASASGAMNMDKPGEVKLWDAMSGQETLTLRTRGRTGVVWSVAFSTDGKRLASASYDGTVKVWDTTSGQETLTLKAHTRPVNSVAFSADGKWLASASGGLNMIGPGEVKVWNATSGQETLTLNGHSSAVTRVTFSTVGNRLASASMDKTVKVWDATSGLETLTLKGHIGPVLSVAFSPDGKRLASASGDPFIPGYPGEVKVWDAESGLETLSLKGHGDAVTSIAFSADGQRLASASDDHSVKVWDARPWTPELRADQEARSLLIMFCANAEKGSSTQTLEHAIQSDDIISEPVRRRALEWAGSYWNALVSAPTTRLVNQLFVKGRLKDEVIQSITEDATLSDAVRFRAIELVRARRDDPEALNLASWRVVAKPDQSVEQYRHALGQIESAVRIDPENGLFLNTLGVAQYRVGRYADALKTLTRSDEINAKSTRGSDPADAAFLAMTEHQLGNKDRAMALLNRLRELMKHPQLAENAEAQAIQREAETLIGVQPKE